MAEAQKCQTYLAPAYIAILAVCASTGWICAGALYIWHRKTSKDKHDVATFNQQQMSALPNLAAQPPSYSDMQTPYTASPWKSRIPPPTPRSHRPGGSSFSQGAARSAFSAPPALMQQPRPPHRRAGSYY